MTALILEAEKESQEDEEEDGIGGLIPSLEDDRRLVLKMVNQANPIPRWKLMFSVHWAS